MSRWAEVSQLMSQVARRQGLTEAEAFADTIEGDMNRFRVFRALRSTGASPAEADRLIEQTKGMPLDKETCRCACCASCRLGLPTGEACGCHCCKACQLATESHVAYGSEPIAGSIAMADYYGSSSGEE